MVAPTLAPTEDAEQEFPHPPRPSTHWTEYYYFQGFDPDAGAGVSIHIGREPFDPGLWRAAVSVYQPDGEVLVGRYVGRDGHVRGPGAGPLRITCVAPEELWVVEFDGVAQRFARAELAAGTPADRTAEPLSFALAFHAIAPLDSMNVTKLEGEAWASGHWDQLVRMSGDITVGGRRTAVGGPGVRDHSAGARDYGPVTGSAWFTCVFEDGSGLVVTHVTSADGRSLLAPRYLPAGATSFVDVELTGYPAAGKEAAGSLPRDPLADPACSSFGFSFVHAGRRHDVKATMLHGAITSFLPPSDEVLGTATGPGLQVAECPIEVRCGDLRGHGLRERTVLLTALRDGAGA